MTQIQRSTSRQALQCYKHLYRTIREVFGKDFEAIQISRAQIRQEFLRNSTLEDPELIDECIRVGYDSANLLKKMVIQAKLNAKGNYEAVITKDHIDGPP